MKRKRPVAKQSGASPASPRRSVCALGVMALSFVSQIDPLNRRHLLCGSFLVVLGSAAETMHACRFVPQLEALEKRSLPSTLTVLNALDSPLIGGF